MRLATPSGALSTDHWWQKKPARASAIAALATAGIVAHAVLRWGAHASPFVAAMPLYIVLAAGGTPLVVTLAIALYRREFHSDLLAGLSIVSAVSLHEYLAGALVVLMLSGGAALESFALGRAS